MDKNVYELLKQWCDCLLDLQISGTGRTQLDGGLICPACGIMHGRCADLLYPLTYLYTITADEKYILAAERLSDWAEQNLQDINGLYRNDFNDGWMGISAFHCDCLYEALTLGNGVMPQRIYDKFHSRFIRMTDVIYNWFEKYDLTLVTNYYAGGAVCLSERYVMTGEERFKQRSLEWLDTILSRVTDDNMLYGEGYNNHCKTDEQDTHGCYQVDLGYNMEETIPFIIKSGILLNNNEALEKGKSLMRTALEFMLPDGGIDAGWCSRSIKWTYYGSRTSDGMQAGLVLCPDEPLFLEAAYRNFELIKSLTVDGLLSGGAMYREANEPCCIHHSFEHAKALTAMCACNIEFSHTSTLPCEVDKTGKAYPSVGINIIRKGGLLASVYYGAYEKHPQEVAVGGSLNMLYTEKSGLIIASTVARYSLVELKNMQNRKRMLPVYSMNPRIEKDGYSQCFALNFDCTRSGDVYSISGKLANAMHGEGDCYSVSYTFAESGVTVCAECDGGEYILPIVSDSSDEVTVNGSVAEIKRASSTITITSSAEIRLWDKPGAENNRYFTPVGGFTYCIFSIPLNGMVTLTIAD